MSKKLEIRLLSNECWWGGIVRHGLDQPYGDKPLEDDLDNLDGNQGCPLLVSNKGRNLWCEDPFRFSFTEDALVAESPHSDLFLSEGHGNLRGAYLAASGKYFPPSGRIPHELCFTAPQYNSWIELHHWPTRDKVMEYTHSILDHGFPPGVMIIDNYWYRWNGNYRWDIECFPDPKGLVDELRRLGFPVVLWVSPFVTSDSRTYKIRRDAGGLLREADGEPAIRSWWDGYSACFDFSNPDDVAYYQKQLDDLVADYGVSGFKFDGGDPYYYRLSDKSFAPTTPNGHCEAFGRLGLKYPISEYRACWKLGGQPMIQRVRDKRHTFDVGGMADLLPTAFVQGLVGYPFTCPDMVGGGELGSFSADDFSFDPEVFVRYAQISSFFPIIQYSFLPQRMLKGEMLDYATEAIRIRRDLGSYFLETARHAGKTNEPILRHMDYEFPDSGLERVNDQFMCGDRYLVAPVLQAGQDKKGIHFPAGKWKGDDGSVVAGPCEQEVEAPISRLPWYERIG